MTVHAVVPVIPRRFAARDELERGINCHTVILTTERLVLRPPELADALAIQELAGARDVALNTLNIPHPYPDGAAEWWINKQRTENEVNFVITLRATGEMVGIIGLIVNREHARAEIGYWIAVPHWNRGYATEAGRAVLRHAFDDLKLNRVFAEHFTRNASSGRVMQKMGMRHEGTLRRHIIKWGEVIDVELYAAVRDVL
jgi:ribosomal-protein-alanine N-acetyltransferase